MSAAYLVQQDSSWCFRLRVPADLQDIIGKKELRYSLKTGLIGEANTRLEGLLGTFSGFS